MMLMLMVLTMVLMMIMLVLGVYAANYDHANNYGYDSAEHDDHSAETHCTFND